MPKSKPPRSRLRRATGKRPLDAVNRRMIDACEKNIEVLQRMLRDVERVAHAAPADELAHFREEMQEGIRCWTSVRNIYLEGMHEPRKPAWPGIVKALEAEARKA